MLKQTFFVNLSNTADKNSVFFFLISSFLQFDFDFPPENLFDFDLIFENSTAKVLIIHDFVG